MREDWSHLEKFRQSPKGYESKKGDTFGWFVWLKGRTQIRAMAVDGTETGWEHVSVSVAYVPSESKKNWKERDPRWEEMVFIKQQFWNHEECVVQFHPPAKDYVNVHNHCLHLWKCVNQEFPMPSKICV